jgi:Protein of unknown function (DUF3311)
MSEPGIPPEGREPVGTDKRGGTGTRGGKRMRPVRRVWYLLLLLPFAATLVPPVYAREEPSIGGWPFFYWWQFAWVVITAIIVAVVYRVTTERVPADRPARSDAGGRPADGS